MEPRPALIHNDVRIAVRITKIESQVAEGLGFEVAPGQSAGRAEDETGRGDVIDELFGIVEVGSPGNVPGERSRARAHRLGRPVHCRIPRCCAAAPGFAVEAADVRCIFNDFAALSMGQHAHELIATVEVVGEGLRAGRSRCLVGFNLVTADLVTRFRAFDQTVAVGGERKTRQT